MITTFYPPYNFGGDGIFVHRLSHALALRGHRVEVIHCTDAYRLFEKRNPAQPYDDHPNVKVHGLKSRFGFLSPLATQQTGHPLFKSRRIQEILEEDFDVIHYHNISLVGGPGILKYGNATKLYTTHEYWLTCPTNMLFRFNSAPCTKKHCVPCSMIHRRPPQWWRHTGLLKAMVKHVDAFIAPTRFTMDVHRQMDLDLPLVHLPHFVPETEDMESTPTSNNTSDAQENGPYFLFVGRLEKVKGLQTILSIFHTYGKARLLIAGTGGYESTLRRLAKSSANIRFLGYLSDQQLQTLYRNAVAVIVPSIWLEVFGLVIVEAFSQKTPAIVRNSGGMPEIIEESNGGLVYDREEDLVSAMDRLLADPSYQCTLGQRGYQAFKKKWSTNAHMERYLALIHEIAAKRGL
jgi:glycosyltransferase involved in cell wall biosynthesis